MKMRNLIETVSLCALQLCAYLVPSPPPHLGPCRPKRFNRSFRPLYAHRGEAWRKRRLKEGCGSGQPATGATEIATLLRCYFAALLSYWTDSGLRWLHMRSEHDLGVCRWSGNRFGGAVSEAVTIWLLL